MKIILRYGVPWTTEVTALASAGSRTAAALLYGQELLIDLVVPGASL